MRLDNSHLLQYGRKFFINCHNLTIYHIYFGKYFIINGILNVLIKVDDIF